MKKNVFCAWVIVCWLVCVSALPPAAGAVGIPPASKSQQGYGNEAFRNVTVSKTDTSQYVVKGQARVLEGNVRYVVTDGATTLINSFVSASRGGLSWGSYELNLNLPGSKQPLTLILFEEIAHTGARRHELKIPLP
ncbi:Gmad2 immunoglobulin-like domain-containing protein [Brevibacillus aydinogluensis]|jgi:Immunoglobulin-like domain of bacterial spore germination|uniref:Spore gernimation protein n=1 Tax=Brevibacillus aydinogluensis TaxID=927786 RepID=A0AA48M9D2_9BACL|nr:Gmad2 immunoglobulin-like domain-containing protein [Brevibacillus aydinogluensis]CAJ1002060.1 Spore gernimation protein [Brevibacillus aydinogluensis]